MIVMLTTASLVDHHGSPVTERHSFDRHDNTDDNNTHIYIMIVNMLRMCLFGGPIPGPVVREEANVMGRGDVALGGSGVERPTTDMARLQTEERHATLPLIPIGVLPAPVRPRRELVVASGAAPARTTAGPKADQKPNTRAQTSTSTSTRRLRITATTTATTTAATAKPPYPKTSIRASLASTTSSPSSQVARDLVHLQRQYDELCAKMHALSAKNAVPHKDQHFRQHRPNRAKAAAQLTLNTPAPRESLPTSRHE